MNLILPFGKWWFQLSGEWRRYDFHMKIWELEKTEVLGCEVRLFVIMMTVVQVAHCSGKG